MYIYIFYAYHVATIIADLPSFAVPPRYHRCYDIILLDAHRATLTRACARAPRKDHVYPVYAGTACNSRVSSSSHPPRTHTRTARMIGGATRNSRITTCACRVAALVVLSPPSCAPIRESTTRFYDRSRSSSTRAVSEPAVQREPEITLWEAASSPPPPAVNFP